MTPRTATLEDYLAQIGRIRATGAGVEETSYYPAIAGALNELGRTLKPRVQCVLQLANRGAGLPDGGLFTADQCKNADLARPLLDQAPARGVIEVKPPSDDLDKVIGSDQIERYWKTYRLVLLTNYRAFALVGQSREGRPAVLERFELSESEGAFWKLAEHPRSAASRLGAPFDEYLRRVLLHNAPLASPRDVAAILASYARDALARVEQAQLPTLAGLRSALSEALGLRFEGPRGEHFFRSTLVQTLFYGIFAAWVLWARSDRKGRERSFSERLKESGSPYGADPDQFDWRSAEWSLRLPVIRALFEQVATPSKLGPLGLVEILEWTAAALNRVDHAEFFRSFDEGHAVQYFYEPFLEAFDPVLRKELGVWYTPEEIVEYQVARVDTVLREELGIADGLADSNVFVLDPCCGTGAYLRLTLAKIAETLREKGGDALVAHDLKRAAMDRVFGFEILPAPFVISHLQLGLLLQKLGAPLSESKAERVGVYLTNSLVGWEPPKGPKQRLIFAEMEEERDAAERIKRDTPILVILGNPPYNGYAGVAVDEERELTTAYRKVKRVAPPQGQGLNDLFVRFYRMAERRIVEKTGRGVVCFISNYSWLDGLSFTGVRERFLEAFDQITIDCLNGDKYKTGKLTPEGDPDPSVFSTEHNREGIQVGTAIALLVKSESTGGGGRWGTGSLEREAGARVRFRHLWGEGKREQLVATKTRTSSEQKSVYEDVAPVLELGLCLVPATTPASYLKWPRLTELLPQSFPGVQSSRDHFVVDIDRDQLEERLRLYFDPRVGHEEMARIAPSAMTRTARFDPIGVRDRLRKRGFLPENIVRYAYRPFDDRWLYWEPETKLLDEKRAEYVPHVFQGNTWLASAQRTRKNFDPPVLSSVHCCRHLIERGANLFPMLLAAGPPDLPLLSEAGSREVNLTEGARSFLETLGAGPQELFFHAAAILHAPAYAGENADALRQGWPRVPLPAKGDRLEASAELGKRVAALLNLEAPVPGVTTGKIDPALREIAVLTRADGEAIDPDSGDLDVTAGWGHAGKGGVTMPGRGRITEHDDALDIWMNEVAFWRNVPKSAWDYTIGGYQVIKKWLSYREKALLGRALMPDEARYVTEMARRIAALLSLGPALDENYGAVRSDAVDFSTYTASKRGK